ncbi:MAG: FAD-binding oxidoreductase [Myxococcota bacterium]|nr:FAD-binding oxidoreductase [Myxococcota bacterium]
MSPRRVETPRNRDALVELLRAAVVDDGGQCLALGSQTSKSPCFKTRGLGVLLSEFNVLERRGPFSVRVGAGTILSDLLVFLRAEGLALPTIGEWSGQTVGGAISTGTHGGSYRYGSLCSSVESATVMNAEGEVHTLRRGEANFSHLLPSFGTTGIALEYELRCTPHFDVCVTRRCVPFETYVDDLVHNPEHAVFRSAIWLPALGCVIDDVADPVEALPLDHLTDREVRFNDTAIVLDWLAKRSPGPRRAKRWLRARHTVNATLSRSPKLLFPQRHYRGAYDDMLAPLRGSASEILSKRKKNSTPPEGEFAVTEDKAAAFLRALDRYFRSTGHYPDRPVGLRPGAQEHGTLAATQTGPSTWVSMFIDTDNPLMTELPDMLAGYGARPHWGKCVFHRPSQIASMYRDWDSFEAFRANQDPHGRFLNDFAKGLGLGHA